MKSIQETSMQLHTQYADEHQMRINAESDIGRLRE